MVRPTIEEESVIGNIMVRHERDWSNSRRAKGLFDTAFEQYSASTGIAPVTHAYIRAIKQPGFFHA